MGYLFNSLVAGSLVVGATAAFADAPNPDEVYIKRLTYSGDGCASGTVASHVSSDAKAFTLVFERCLAHTRPRTFTPAFRGSLVPLTVANLLPAALAIAGCAAGLYDVDRTVHHMQDEAANFPDPHDRATQESEFGLELRTRDRERKLIKKIDESLMNLDNDEYGYCEACGVEIGVKRLEARPTATLCIDCKILDEIKEKQMG